MNQPTAGQPLKYQPHSRPASAVKTIGPSCAGAPGPAHSQVQRKLLAFFYVYALLIVSLYATYAAYYYYQQHSQREGRRREPRADAHLSGEAAAGASLAEVEAKLDAKLHLLERYIEVLALDLQDAKSKLREREKCHCALGCTFNATKYADQSTWQHQCDTCTCQVSSAPGSSRAHTHTLRLRTH